MNSTIYGRVGKDAEVKDTQSGTVIARVSVALNVYDRQEKLTTWVNAMLFGKQAESLAQYLTKGTSVAMTGDLKLREYESNDGTVKTTLDMNVQAVALLGGGAQAEQAPASRPAQRTAARPAAASKGGYKPAARAAAPAEPDISDEDTPF